MQLGAFVLVEELLGPDDARRSLLERRIRALLGGVKDRGRAEVDRWLQLALDRGYRIRR